MAWQSYELDRAAQKLVLAARERDPKSLNQSHKMRMSVAYGLERFWGEHLRLQGKKLEDQNKSKYWKATWDAFCDVMENVDIKLPKDAVGAEDTKKIQAISTRLWALPVEDQRVAIAVLTQLCDCIVWWTQRYKIGRLADESDS
ncbi:hypothetical protein ACN4EG_17640 [Alkalinema pantanalense CENA528]|uniref:hypothetical protein n=1 Tax=Alkalinema pantanalense TaxID=1620705 RepID=UPI003D6F1FAE